MDWVAPHLTGGLGNRLFTYAAAAAAAKKWGRRVVFFMPRCGETSHGPFDSIFKLLPSVPILQTAAEWHTVLELKGTLFIYQPFSEVAPSPLPCVIHGWRQTEKYFEDVPVHVDFEGALGSRAVAIRHTIKETSWFMHVRLGDYKILAHHQVDLTNYYTFCLKQIPLGSTVVFFSDEPELCAHIYKGIVEGIGLTFQIFDSKDEVESLYAMSLCKGGAIVANSTFSWWGAYFARQGAGPAFKAYYPSVWGSALPPPTDVTPSWGISV